MNFHDLRLRLSSLSPIRYTAEKCQHRTKRCGRVSAFGHSIITRMPKNASGTIDWCLACIAKMAIRCAWCGRPIFIGDPITLYSPGPKANFFSSHEPSEAQQARVQEHFKVPGDAVIYSERPLTLVGCLGWSCADTGGDRAGFWMPGGDGRGKVMRVPTAEEVLLGLGEGECLALIIHDTHDVKEAMNPKIIRDQGAQ